MPHIVRKISDSNPHKITCGILRALTTSEDFKNADVAHITITGSTKKHYHKKLTEWYYVLKGKMDVELDGIVEHLEEGSIIMISPNTDHKAWAVGENAEILVICSPPWAEDDEILNE